MKLTESVLSQQLTQQQQENDALRSDLAKKDDESFIKALARDLLGLAEEGERIFYDVNALNFDVQLRLAKGKLERGIIGFLTQPVLTEQAFENLKRAREELGGAYILGGIIPVVSAKNARFMDSEINGIRVDETITQMYEGKNRAEGEELAVTISAEIAKRIAPYVDGYYLMTPFQRTALICRILEKIKEQA